MQSTRLADRYFRCFQMRLAGQLFRDGSRQGLVENPGFAFISTGSAMFQLRQSFLLFLTATIWGSGFVAQSIGMDHVTPFTYTFFRTLIGAIVLLPIVFWIKSRADRTAADHHNQSQAGNDSRIPDHVAPHPSTYTRKDLFTGSWVCGLFLVGGESFQQFGLVTTDAGKAGFLTSMYIIFVPLVGLFIGKKLNASIVTGVVLSLVGLYLLCIKDSFTIEQGDLLILTCAFVFTFHILTIDHFIKKCDAVYLSCGQFFAASFIALILMIVVDGDVFAWEDVWAASLALLWSGVMSNGVAYTLQVVGQRGMHPTIATLILSLESVMAVVFGVLILNESLTIKEGIGCLMILAAVIVAQLNFATLAALFGRISGKNKNGSSLISKEDSSDRDSQLSSQDLQAEQTAMATAPAAATAADSARQSRQ